MKRINNIFDKICSIDNLMLAVKNAEKGKLKSYGVKLFYRNENQNIIDLHKSLKEGTFKAALARNPTGL